MMLNEKELESKSNDKFSENFLSIHENLPIHLATPRHYLSLLGSYQTIYNKKKDGIIQRQQHLQVL